jgi:hypothetical protein
MKSQEKVKSSSETSKVIQKNDSLESPFENSSIKYSAEA